MTKRISNMELGSIGLTFAEANFVIEYTKDFNARRAATASGYSADSGYAIRDRENIASAVQYVLGQRLEASHIDAEWVLMEAVDNHLLARQSNNLNASNAALNLVAKHVFVDAFAADKVEVTSDKEILERLMRGRKRLRENGVPDEGSAPVSFM